MAAPGNTAKRSLLSRSSRRPLPSIMYSAVFSSSSAKAESTSSSRSAPPGINRVGTCNAAKAVRLPEAVSRESPRPPRYRKKLAFARRQTCQVCARERGSHGPSKRGYAQCRRTAQRQRALLDLQLRGSNLERASPGAACSAQRTKAKESTSPPKREQLQACGMPIVNKR